MKYVKEGKYFLRIYVFQKDNSGDAGLDSSAPQVYIKAILQRYR